MRKPNPSFLAQMGLILATSLLAVGCGGSSSTAVVTPPPVAPPSSPNDALLAFDATKYTTVNVTVDGAPIVVHRYRVVYCAKPIKMSLYQPATMAPPGTPDIKLNDPYEYQTMYISVPAASFNDQKAPIYFRVNNGGWFASRVDGDQQLIKDGAVFTPGTFVDGDLTHSAGDGAAVGSALKAGYIVAEVGSRSRGACRAEDGTWQGKSPAPIVDVKAAIRYLKLNDSLIPGSSERIICTGTSGGGLTAQIAGSGNAADYYPFLAEIGAAGIVGSGATATSLIKDDVFAAVAYCPINNLGNADSGYEWQYNAIRTASNTPAINGVNFSTTGVQGVASAAIASTFPTYLNALKLTTDGSTLLTDANINAATADVVKAEVVRRVQAGTIPVPLDADGSVSFSVPGFGPPTNVPNTWLTVAGTQTTPVVTIDFTKYLQFVATGTQLKSVVAFDGYGVTGNIIPGMGESSLFGAPDLLFSNFTAWCWNNNNVTEDSVGKDNTGLDWTAYLSTSAGQALAKQIKLINPEAYLNSGASVAPYWYIRHGSVDRDTSFAMQTMLYYAVKNNATVKDLNFNYPWLTPHSGNYDVNEAFTWIKAKVAAAN